jgi:hypothetical protein
MTFRYRTRRPMCEVPTSSLTLDRLVEAVSDQLGESIRTGDTPTRGARSDSRRASCLAPIFRFHRSPDSSRLRKLMQLR